MKVTIGLQYFNILGYHRIAILQYIANYLFLQRTLTVQLNTEAPEVKDVAGLKSILDT